MLVSLILSLLGISLSRFGCSHPSMEYEFKVDKIVVPLATVSYGGNEAQQSRPEELPEPPRKSRVNAAALEALHAANTTEDGIDFDGVREDARGLLREVDCEFKTEEFKSQIWTQLAESLKATGRQDEETRKLRRVLVQYAYQTVGHLVGSISTMASIVSTGRDTVPPLNDPTHLARAHTHTQTKTHTHTHNQLLDFISGITNGTLGMRIKDISKDTRHGLAAPVDLEEAVDEWCSNTLARTHAYTQS
jgi:hypothetical protein